MTSDPHLDVEQIADLLADVPPADAAMRANAHLAVCQVCADTRDDLLEVRRVLAEAGAEPIPMPDDVAAHLATVLVEAGTERASGVTQLSTASSGAGERRRRLVRWVTGAAAAIVVVALGVAGLQALPRSSSSDSAGSSPAARAESGAMDGLALGQQADGKHQPASTGGSVSQPLRPQRVTVSAFDATSVGAAALKISRNPDLIVPPSSGGCAVPVADSSVATVIQYADQRAVLAIMRASRTATVFDCRSGTRSLITTGY